MATILQESWPPTRFLARYVRSWPAWTTTFLQEPFVWVYYMYGLNYTQLRDNFHYGHSCSVSTNMWMVTYPTGGNPCVQCSLICLIKKWLRCHTAIPSVIQLAHGITMGSYGANHQVNPWLPLPLSNPVAFSFVYKADHVMVYAQPVGMCTRYAKSESVITIDAICTSSLVVAIGIGS